MPNLTVATIIMKDRASVLLLKAEGGPDSNLWALPDTTVADNETVRAAAIRVGHNLGLAVEPKMTLFICERVVPDDHRVGVFVLAEPTIELGGKEPAVLSPPRGVARWVDVRNLGELQKTEGMSDFTADAFVKFSSFLKSQTVKSGTVN
jgi:ADP-ribose pyrophosphatase YjhB (NUDIX family)